VKRLVVVLALSACDQSIQLVDLTGVYQVGTDVSSKPCGSDVPVSQPAPFVTFSENDVLGGFWMQSCADRAATNCWGDKYLGAYPGALEDGWQGTVSGASETCFLTYRVQTAKLFDGTHLVVETTEYGEQSTTVVCTAHDAEVRGSLMPCTLHERIDATRL
jgi:hypothetical protein